MGICHRVVDSTSTFFFIGASEEDIPCQHSSEMAVEESRVSVPRCILHWVFPQVLTQSLHRQTTQIWFDPIQGPRGRWGSLGDPLSLSTHPRCACSVRNDTDNLSLPTLSQPTTLSSVKRSFKICHLETRCFFSRTLTNLDGCTV